MNLNGWNFSLCLFFIVYGGLTLCLDYSDLEAQGVSCPARDSCSAGDTDRSFTDGNCECDNQCSHYNDCCIDSQAVLSRRRTSTRRSTPTCATFGGYVETGVYVVDKCPRNFSGSAEVRSKCENPGDWSDPIMAVFTTDSDAGITYLNRYCSECHNVPARKLTAWNLKVNCESLVNNHNVSQDYILDHLQYEDDVWGVDHGSVFHTCDLIPDLPTYLADDVRLCRAKTISTCSRNWRRLSIKRACEAYMAIVYDGDIIYRNPHCALCNDVQIDTLACDRGISSRKKQPMSFALLLDVNRNDGDVVGMTRASCPRTQTYDSFKKVCRNITCAIPGFTLVNGRCSPR